MTVSVCVVAYNEEKDLPSLLLDFEKQSYDHSKIEIILVDGMSTDKTKQIMLDFQSKQNDFLNIKVFDNKGKISSSGWNVAIENSTCDCLMRIDAHATIPNNFVELNIKNLEAGESVSGGIRPCLIKDETAWKRVLLQTENSLFGSSINSSRRGNEKKYVKTMFHATYKREVFEKIGGFNEKLKRTEDNEFHYRVRKAGFKLAYDPQIISYQYARSDLKKMLKQKYGNGYWIGLTMGVCPKCFSLFHLIPLCFVLGIILTTVLAIFGLWQFSAVMWGAYALFAVLNTVITMVTNKFEFLQFLMPFLFLFLHLSYGIGTLIGIVKMPFYRKKLQTNTGIKRVKKIVNEKNI